MRWINAWLRKNLSKKFDQWSKDTRWMIDYIYNSCYTYMRLATILYKMMTGSQSTDRLNLTPVHSPRFPVHHLSLSSTRCLNDRDNLDLPPCTSVGFDVTTSTSVNRVPFCSVWNIDYTDHSGPVVQTCYIPNFDMDLMHTCKHQAVFAGYVVVVDFLYKEIKKAFENEGSQVRSPWGLR